MRCPECNGRGVTFYYVETDRDENIVTAEQIKDICRTCNGSGEKPMTNAERIRAMTDEELVKLLLDADQGNFTVAVCDERFCDTENCKNDCAGAALKWLQQPAEGE